MKKNFTERNGLNLPEVGRQMLKEWEEEDLFHKSIEEREGCPQFVFFEGPPSANGHPGIHHVLARSLKDTFCRYQTMNGKQVYRKAGWDTHGLPVELGVEKELGITKEDIGHSISIEDYNRRCRQNVMKYTGEWTDLSERMGYWVDMEHPYITYDNKYIETLWWLLKQLYQKDMLYKGYTIQPYSPAAGTGLSSHELNQPGCYRDVKDTTVTAQFKVTDQVPFDAMGQTVYALAWTTTPWTLPSNTALCVGPKIEYVAVKGQNPYTNEEAIYILAEARLAAHFPATKNEDGTETAPEILWRGMGTDLVGLHYQQLMPWVKPCDLVDDQVVDRTAEAFRIIPGDYVTTEDGTGIVHIAPTFGADDAKVARDAGIPSLFVIDKAGDTRPMVDFQGRYFVRENMRPDFVEKCVCEAYWKHSGDYVKNAYDPKYNKDGKYDEKAAAKDMDLNVVLVIEMKEQGTAFRIEKHVHNYPHCWRTDKPILYYPLDSWFIRASKARERMMELNDTIHWKPESTGTGRFGKWLENLNDWNLSRSRFWGTPLPIWRDEDRNEKCIGSVEELYNEIEKAVEAGVMKENPLKVRGFVVGDNAQENYDRIDLHRPYVDDIVLVSDTGKPMHRESDLIDVWFDSGSMPYAQLHYPFEGELNAEKLAATGKSEAEYRDQLIHSCYEGTPVPPAFFPAEFINEGVDQTRGWFFTLHAIGTMVFDSVAFRNVISTGLVLDAKGNKMSKHVGNVVPPFEMIEKYGADAVRFYMMTNSEPWDNLKFDENGVDECRRRFFGTLYNTYSFFALYANVDGYDPKDAQLRADAPEIDRWIISRLNTLVKGVSRELDGYDPTRAGRLIEQFVNDELSNWYVRLNRKRFWGKDMSDDKRSAYDTLYTCLMTVAHLLAPFAPFMSDELYHDLGGQLESIHLDRWPKADEARIDADLEARMDMAQKITSMVLALRRKVNIKVRQPLAQIMVPAIDEEQRRHIEAVAALIKSEVNVKELNFVEGEGLLVKKVKCNFRVMGKKFGKLMKGVAAKMNTLSQAEIVQLEREGSIGFEVEGQPISVDATDVEIISEDMPGWLVSNEGNLTVALEVELTDDLRREGMARELINRIQNLRKESGLEITDRIVVSIDPHKETDEALETFGDLVRQQVLANEIVVKPTDGDEIDLGDFTTHIAISKA